MSGPLEEAAEAFRDVTLEVAEPNGMTKHPAATLFDPTSGLEEPPALDLL